MKRNIFNILIFVILLASCRSVKEVRVIDTLHINIPVNIPESEVRFDQIEKMAFGDTLMQENDTVIVTIYKDTIKYKVKVKYKDVISLDTVVVVDTIVKLKYNDCSEIKNDKTFFEKIKIILTLLIVMLIIILIIIIAYKKKTK